MASEPIASPLSRRRMLALSGATLAAGSSAVLAACGAAAAEDEEASPEENATLLNEVLAQQLGVLAAAELALGASPSELNQPIFRLRTARAKSTQALTEAIGELGGSATRKSAAQAAQAESAVEGLARQLEASIAATLDAIGELSPERRQPVHRAITEDAATLAALRSTLGEEIAPDAFVLGPAAGDAA